MLQLLWRWVVGWLRFFRSQQGSAELLAFAVAGALAPDIDFFIRPFHRELLHNVFALLLFALLVFSSAGAVASLFFVAGFLSHLALDMLTPAGVALFWPVSDQRYGVGLIRTGSVCDGVVGLLFAVVALHFAGLL